MIPILAWVVAGGATLAAAAMARRRMTAPVPGAEAPTWSAEGADVIALAAQWLGTPYVEGGTTPGVALDCSGLTQCAWGYAGRTLPRTAAQQYAASTPVATPAPGDIGFYVDRTGKVVHAVLYAGGGTQIEAGTNGVMHGPVRQNATPDSYGETFAGWRRP